MARRKCAQTDFDVAKLPANRRQLFYDVYKNRWALMIDLGLLLLLFFLPVIGASMLTLAQSAQVNQSLAQGQISAREAAVRLVQLQNAGNILLIPMLAVFSLGLAGAAKVVKNLVWQEGVLLKSDFLRGIRENGGCFALTALVAGAIHYVAQYLIHLGFFESGTALDLSLACILAAAVLFGLVMPFVLIQSTIYNLSYLQKFRNGFLLAMRSFFPGLGLLALNGLPFLLLLIDDHTVYIFSMLLLPILAMPLLVLVDTLCVHSILDKYINKTHFPQIYRKGLVDHADDPDT